jgi:hypothetical protein
MSYIEEKILDKDLLQRWDDYHNQLRHVRDLSSNESAQYYHRSRREKQEYFPSGEPIDDAWFAHRVGRDE